MNRQIFKYIPALLFSLFLLIVWEYYSIHSPESKIFFPAPSTVIKSLLVNREIIFNHTLQTAAETVIGFGIAIVLGFVLSIFLSLSSHLRKMLYPLMVWFGFDLVPKVIMVVLFCFFPITLVFTGALMAVENDFINLLESMNATKWKILTMVRIPLALPSFFSGLKIAATYAMTGAIVGEFVGGYQGLGIYMVTASNSHAYGPVFAAIAVASLLTIFLVLIVTLLERIIIPWHFQK